MSQWPTQQGQGQQPQWSQPPQEQQYQYPSEQQQRRQFQWSSQPEVQQPQPQWHQSFQGQQFQPLTQQPMQQLQQPLMPPTMNTMSTRKKRRALSLRWLIPAIIVVLILAAGVYRYFSPLSVAKNAEKAIFHGDLITAYSLTCPWYQHQSKTPVNVRIPDHIDDSGLTANIVSESPTSATVAVSGTVNITAPTWGSGPLKVDKTIQLEANGISWCIKPG